MINKTDNICFMQDKFQRVTDKNNVGNTNVLTISAQHGLINQFEYYNHQYASENTSGYTLLHKGDFAYNKSYSDGYPWGATKRLERYDSGVVSPLYICFAAKDGVCADFYSYYFESEPFYREIYKIAQEGARNHGLLNVATEDFFKIRIANPPLEEQRRIAEILGCCDRVIALKKELIAEKKKQKKALMQKLLNPDSGFRLPGFSGERKIKTYAEIFDKIPVKKYQISSNEYRKQGLYPIIDQGQEIVVAYSDDPTHVFHCPMQGVIIFGDHTRELKYASFDFIIGADGTQVFTTIRENCLYMFYFCKMINIPNLGYNRHFSYIKSASFAVHSSLLEQQAIADILSAADKEIDLLEQELAQQEQKKKSLMQLLLTGTVRV